MKHKFEHPPEDPNGRKYWKSLDSLGETPEFQKWLEQEFPESVTDIIQNPISRRGFLRIMGASLALAGVSSLSGCRRPETYIVPYTKTPEWIVPGRSTLYATSMPRRMGAMPLLITTYEGRPTKIEGNPHYPSGNGATDLQSQASILGLYDPDRSRSFLHNGTAVTREVFDAHLADLREKLKKDKGASLAFLFEGSVSPTGRRLQAELARQFPKARWASYDPLSLENEEEAARVAFGPGTKVVPDFSKAEIIFSIDSNFLDPEEGGLVSVREFSKRRRVASSTDPMNRLYVAESHFTITGGMADHRLRIPASQMGTFLALLANELVKQGVSGLEPFVQAVMDREVKLSLDPKWIEEAARDLIDHRGNSLIVVGKRQPASLHLLAYAIDQALGNVGRSLQVVENPEGPREIKIGELAEEISRGKVSTLFILGGNPVYNAPSDLDWAARQRSVSEVIHLGLYEDETAKLSQWHAPMAHYLEAWGDDRGQDGSYVSRQPMTLPLYGGISEIELLASLAGLPKPEGPELVQETFKGFYTGLDPSRAWEKFVHDGFLAGTASVPSAAAFDADKTRSYIKKNFPKSATLGASSLEVVFTADPKVNDGRYNNNGWLQEVPDPITKITWDNAALVSPKTAGELGLKDTDVVKISVGPRMIEAPIFITPGQSDHSLTLPLGYGRTETGKVGTGTGFSSYPLRTSENPYYAVGATVSKTGRTYSLSQTQEHYSMEGRDLVREARLDQYQKDPEFMKHTGLEAEGPKIQSYYKNPALTGKHQWGMAIDLNTCTGCNACVVACQSENNVPIVGKDQVRRGREMHWIRLDRYFTGDIEDPQMVMEPVACMQCENAPCETVCPVNATVHSEEGLNVMVYNRCIGTRYCANNCPYKVRRFNYFDFNQRPLDRLYQGPLAPKGMADTLKMQKNPNVTVRMRGVMEKCTFCVQRIEAAKIDQLVRAGDSSDVKVKTDTVKSACQQACPAEAITFGDISDPESKVAKLKGQELNYSLLYYLATFPRISFLGKLRNPNMRMPGADKIGLQKGHAE